jgi:rhodanese-related sulfurtransferase
MSIVSRLVPSRYGTSTAPATSAISLYNVPISEIEVAELAKRVAAGALVLDVRTPDEYAAGHVPGAVSVPLDTIADNFHLFSEDDKTYLICQGGGRSMKACEMAADEGLDVVNVAGGTGAWIAGGHDYVTGDQPT